MLSRKISGIEALETEAGPLALNKFSFVHLFKFWFDELNDEYVLDLILRKERLSSPGLSIEFRGVNSLEAKKLGDKPTQIMGLDIVDVSDKGLEGINWECFDYEEGLVHLYARLVSITQASSE